MLPIYILKEGTKLPKSEDDYFVVAQGGLYIRKKSDLIDALVKVRGIASLQGIDTYARMNIKKLPAELAVRVLLFLRSVYRRYQTEAVVLLYYSPELQCYSLVCPPQITSIISVDYPIPERFDGYVLVGSIHSHPTWGGSASSIDHRNEKDFDGLHIVMGGMDQPYFTMSCEIVVNGNRFMQNPIDIVEDIHEVAWKPKKKLNYKRTQVSRQTAKENGQLHLLIPNLISFYEIIFSDGRDYRSIRFPKYWIERVEKLTVEVPEDVVLNDMTDSQFEQMGVL